MEAPRLTISISGPDHIGVDELLDLLPRSWPVVFTSSVYRHFQLLNTAAEDIRGRLGFRPTNWWFGENAAQDEQFVDLVHNACVGVQKKAVEAPYPSTPSLPANVGVMFNQSRIMLEAICVARIALVRSMSLDEAESHLRSILGTRTFEEETITIVLRREGDRADAVKDCLRREELKGWRPPEIYRQYQALLHKQIDRQINSGRYQIVLDIPYDEPLICTLSRLTSAIQPLLPPSLSSSFPPLLKDVKCIIALGGLSECGKSTTATSLVASHNAKSAATLSVLDLGCSGGAFRMKNIYLDQKISDHLETHKLTSHYLTSSYDMVYNPTKKFAYDLPVHEWAVEFIHELDSFSRNHKYIELITIESLHNYDFSRRLRELIGNGLCDPSPNVRPSFRPHKHSKLLVVYLDTPFVLRKSRTEDQDAVFDSKKDEVKMSRGAHKIKEVADLVCLNDGSLEETCREVEKEYRKYF